MRRFGFLLSRRWALFLVAVVLLTWLAVWLGQWQFGRLETRRERNEQILRNEQVAPAPVQDVLERGKSPDDALEWRHVSARGTYAPEDTVYVRYRTGDNGAPGVEVVVPLVLEDGTSVLVDRGWLGTGNRGAVPEETPAPPAGEVRIEGWVRVDATGDSTQVDDNSTRAISSRAIGDALGREVYGGFVQLSSESPQPETSLTLPDPPELSDGPHFFYGIQWWFFGFLAVAGFFYLIYDEWRDRRNASGELATPPDPAPTPNPTGPQDRGSDGQQATVDR